jgi:hypothetical protein
MPDPIHDLILEMAKEPNYDERKIAAAIRERFGVDLEPSYIETVISCNVW